MAPFLHTYVYKYMRWPDISVYNHFIYIFVLVHICVRICACVHVCVYSLTFDGRFRQVLAPLSAFITCRKLRFRQVYRSVRFVCLFVGLFVFTITQKRLLFCLSFLFQKSSICSSSVWLVFGQDPIQDGRSGSHFVKNSFWAITQKPLNEETWNFACRFLRWCSLTSVQSVFRYDLPFSSYMQISFWHVSKFSNFVIF